jgi:hypothetical protein
MSFLLDWIQSVIRFIKRNPGKLSIIAIVTIIVSVFLKYFNRFPLLSYKDEEGTLASRSGKLSRPASNPKLSVLRNAQRSRLLLRIRKQYDIACKSFLPTLRKKILETIDINHTIKQIKELRSQVQNSNNPNDLQLNDAENQLWEDVKISSFSTLFLTIYMVSALTTLLKIQLHVLARSFLHKTDSNSSNSTSSDTTHSETSKNDDNLSSGNFDNEMFIMFVEGVYRQLFSNGISFFSNIVTEQVKEDMQEWIVKDKVKVEFEEVKELFEVIRKHIENNKFDEKIKELLLRKCI